MPPTAESLELIRRRHPEWREHQLRWQWLLDSLEGGERYRRAIYGHDLRGLPIRNLIRHKREYPEPREAGGPYADPFLAGPDAFSVGRDPAASATDDDYELRRARTPVPTFVAEAIDAHLSRIYAREVKRAGGERLTAWWSDVDGCGTSIDQWMAEAVAPLLLTLGQLDLAFDHPAAPEGEEVETRADAERLGLDCCVASYILPENMLWWRLDPTGHRYAECLVREFHEDIEGSAERLRYWDAEGSTLYDLDGTVISHTAHPFGRVPIVRVFDRRKPRCKNIGQPRYEGVAERQREYYNRDSELILSDTTQAHPLLQGPEDFIQADGTIPIGPSWLLPKKKNTQGGATTYEGFDVVDFPKDGAESIRKNKADLRDDVDRDTALVSPTGRSGVAQSGLSKAFDHAECNNRLGRIAKALARAEELIAEVASTILDDGLSEIAPALIIYPTEFDLESTDKILVFCWGGELSVGVTFEDESTLQPDRTTTMAKPYPDRKNGTWKVKIKQADGSWKPSLTLRGSDGETIRGLENEAAAIEAAAALVKPIVQDTVAIPTATDDDLRAYALKYQGRHPSKRANGIRRRETVLRRFCAFAVSKGWKTLGSITLREINAWVDHRRDEEKAADGTVVSDLAIIQGMFTAAIDEERISTNPAKLAAKTARKRAASVGDDDEEEIKFYTREQQSRILAIMPMMISKYRDLIMVMLATGMRVDAARHFQASWMHGNYMIDIPRKHDKGQKGYTAHAFGKEAKAIIDRRCQANPSGTIFPEIQSDGRCYHYLDEFYARMTSDGVDDMRDIIEIGSYNHAWRHTFAVRRVEDKIAITVLKDLMGHSDIRITMKYAKVSNHAMMSEIEAIEALVV